MRSDPKEMDEEVDEFEHWRSGLRLWKIVSIVCGKSALGIIFWTSREMKF